MLSKLILAILGTLSLLSSCTPTPDERETLHLNLAEEPGIIDPILARNIRELTLCKQLYEGLYREDLQGKLTPALAERVEISKDLCHYTFYLKESLWSDGTPLTAEDFRRSWMKALDPHTPSTLAHLLFVIKNGKRAKQELCGCEEVKISAPTPQKLVVELEHPVPYFLELTQLPILFPSPSKEGVYNGPFLVERWEEGKSLQLKKNALYWDQEEVELKGITFSFLEDPNLEHYLFEKRELDWLGQPLSHPLTEELYADLHKSGNAHSYPILGTYWITFNTQKPPFDDLRMREAFSGEMNRLVAELVIQGRVLAASSPLPPQVALLSRTSLHPDPLTLVEEYRKEKGDLPEITLLHPASPRANKIAEFLQDEWKKRLHCEVKLQRIERSCYKEKQKGHDYTLCFGEWIADFKDPLAFLTLFTEPWATNWSNPAYPNLLQQALYEESKEKREALLTECEKILLDELPIAPLYHYCFDYAKAKRVEGVALSSLGVADFKYARLRE